jgi:cyclase
MLNKRLIAMVTISDGWVVQSFGYKRLLPIGRPEIVAKNLDRWGADEIVLQFIDRSLSNLGPDFEVLDLIANLGLATPLIYVGGVANTQNAIEAVSRGADRIGIDAMMFDAPYEIRSISERIGSEALIACMPLSIVDNNVCWLDYKTKTNYKLDAKCFDILNRDNFSEILVIDWQNEGFANSFDLRLVQQFPDLGMGLIPFGGISTSRQIRQLLGQTGVVGVAVGNSLNYKESSIDFIKADLEGCSVRAPGTQQNGNGFENL